MTAFEVEKAEAEVTLKVSEETADMLLIALRPEANTPSSDRTQTILEKSFNNVIIHVKARDTVALRACLNSYLRWIQGIVDMVNRIS
jgi:tRNA threonylcarbamoyladenosine modification (KEOPS) complex  Pcc1 subunit